jgi:L-ascorbate metabolism protein UlaG (beta-lactamase superfamily)
VDRRRDEARATRVVALLVTMTWSVTNAAALRAQERPAAASLQQGEAVIHYLGHSGWAVETRQHFLVFDYRESLATPPPGTTFSRPADASLASGWIVPAEIADRNVIVFVSHAHRDHFDPVILGWADSIPTLRYVFGWDYDGPVNALRVDRPRRSFDVDGVRIHTIAHDFDGIPEAAFLVEADGIVLYHSGDHGATASTRSRFEDNIDFLAAIAHPIDIAFTVTWGGEDYMVDRLQPRVVFPQHEGGAEYRLRRWAEQGIGATLNAEVCVVDKRGDRFLFARGKAACAPAGSRRTPMPDGWPRPS